ncbi:hypothetical protein MSG28_000195 [Choristoneura fumiferana]|uniref:Uncharacterized protein n=1 Tax=Choristoneura fumiferana TaxID=7141 RepID=A0ACC0JZI3_CHOFU|nr:hypothetical protein MSG28_000195 [Choristoneura fumiferana]
METLVESFMLLLPVLANTWPGVREVRLAAPLDILLLVTGDVAACGILGSSSSPSFCISCWVSFASSTSTLMRTTACPCKIRLAVDQDTKKVAVYYVCNHHDHDLTESAFYQYPHAKYLPQEVKDVYIHSLVGLTIKRRHIASYAYKFKRKTMQRNLTVERRQYIKDLIATIRGAYKETMDVALKRDSDKNNSLDTTIDDDVNIKLKGPGDANVFDNLLDSNVDLNNHDVIVQYINDEGVLCEQNGAPVTNSSAIMQLITNYENTMAVSNMKDGFLEEGTGFSELVENITDNIYTLDWRCVQETQAEIEEVNIKSTEDVVAANGNMVVATADCELDPDQDMKSNNRPRITPVPYPRGSSSVC